MQIARGLGVLAALVALLFDLAVPSAFAQQGPPCNDADRVETMLEQRYGERIVGFGVIPAMPGRPSGLMSVYANADSGSWTITITVVNDTVPSGYASCVAASGEGFRLTPAEHPDT